MVNILDIINVGLFAAAMRMATPVGVCFFGRVFSERARCCQRGVGRHDVDGGFFRRVDELLHW